MYDTYFVYLVGFAAALSLAGGEAGGGGGGKDMDGLRARLGSNGIGALAPVQRKHPLNLN